MASSEQLIKKRRQELLKIGYPPGIIDISLDWAAASAEGMAKYVLQADLSDDNQKSQEELTVQFLPRYLKDAEKYIQRFGHKPKR